LDPSLQSYKQKERNNNTLLILNESADSSFATCGTCTPLGDGNRKPEPPTSQLPMLQLGTDRGGSLQKNELRWRSPQKNL
jgi:hypothetical protein